METDVALTLVRSGRWVRRRACEVVTSQGAACAFAHRVVDGGMRARVGAKAG